MRFFNAVTASGSLGMVDFGTGTTMPWNVVSGGDQLGKKEALPEVQHACVDEPKVCSIIELGRRTEGFRYQAHLQPFSSRARSY